MLTEIPRTEYDAVLDARAADVLWEAGVDSPPVDAFLLADRLGIEVARDRPVRSAADASRARLARLGGPAASQPTILLTDEPRPERRHWAVAHEVGEAVAARVFESLGVDPLEAPANAREGVANALAGRILLPTRWFRGVWRDADGDLLEVKHVFTTASHELIARRALECVRQSLVVTVTDQATVTWRRWNLSGSTPPRVRLEVECQSQAHEMGSPAWGDGRDEPHTAAGAPIERVRCWPVHEPGWRREITLTELSCDEPEWL